MKPSPRIPLLILAFGALVMTPMGASAQDLEPPPPPPDADVDMNAPPPQAAEPPPQAPDQQAFEQQLAPYGRWVVTPEYGRVWVPANVGPEWQPYADGQWVSTSWGWSFSAPVPWGWAVYHYGRWAWGPALGWYWVHGYVWGPAWVSWRWVNGYACWAPLGPRGYVYGRRWHGWVVVPYAHFTHPIHRWVVPRAQVGVIVRSARPVRSFPGWRGCAFTAHGGGAHHGHGGGRRR